MNKKRIRTKKFRNNHTSNIKEKKFFSNDFFIRKRIFNILFILKFENEKITHSFVSMDMKL